MEEATLYEGNPAKFVRKLSYDEKVRCACTLAHVVLFSKHASFGSERACMSPFRTPTNPLSLSFSLSSMSRTDDICVSVCSIARVFSLCARSVGHTMCLRYVQTAHAKRAASLIATAHSSAAQFTPSNPDYIAAGKVREELGIAPST